MDDREPVHYVWSEYTLDLRPSELAALFNDPRVQTAESKTHCKVYCPRRVLNKRKKDTGWSRLAIVRITGPDDQSIGQCNRLLEQAIPVYRGRREYSRRAPITFYAKNIEADGDLHPRLSDAMLAGKRSDESKYAFKTVSDVRYGSKIVAEYRSYSVEPASPITSHEVSRPVSPTSVPSRGSTGDERTTQQGAKYGTGTSTEQGAVYSWEDDTGLAGERNSGLPRNDTGSLAAQGRSDSVPDVDQLGSPLTVIVDTKTSSAFTVAQSPTEFVLTGRVSSEQQISSTHGILEDTSFPGQPLDRDGLIISKEEFQAEFISKDSSHISIELMEQISKHSSGNLVSHEVTVDIGISPQQNYPNLEFQLDMQQTSMEPQPDSNLTDKPPDQVGSAMIEETVIGQFSLNRSKVSSIVEDSGAENSVQQALNLNVAVVHSASDLIDLTTRGQDNFAFKSVLTSEVSIDSIPPSGSHLPTTPVPNNELDTVMQELDPVQAEPSNPAVDMVTEQSASRLDTLVATEHFAPTEYAVPNERPESSNQVGPSSNTSPKPAQALLTRKLSLDVAADIVKKTQGSLNASISIELIVAEPDPVDLAATEEMELAAVGNTVNDSPSTQQNTHASTVTPVMTSVSNLRKASDPGGVDSLPPIALFPERSTSPLTIIRQFSHEQKDGEAFNETHTTMQLVVGGKDLSEANSIYNPVQIQLYDDMDPVDYAQTIPTVSKSASPLIRTAMQCPVKADLTKEARPNSPLSMGTTISTNLGFHINQGTGEIDFSFEFGSSPSARKNSDLSSSAYQEYSFSAEWNVKMGQNVSFGPVGFISTSMESATSGAAEKP